jgi:hypothetical protein
MTEEIESKCVTGRNIMPVYISAQNPFDFDNEAHRAEVRAKLEADLDYDNMPVEAQRKFKTDMMRIREGRYPTIERAEVQKAIRDLGFDGFYIREGSEKNLAVYKSNQVKSASGNIGTYEAESPDVRYSLRTDGLPNQGKELIQSTAEEFADLFRKNQFNAYVEHSGSAAGPSSYVSISDPLTSRSFTYPFRFSGHSKGPFQSQFVNEMFDDTEFQKILDIALEMRAEGPAKGLMEAKLNEAAKDQERFEKQKVLMETRFVRAQEKLFVFLLNL